jgi:hypothetical protein
VFCVDTVPPPAPTLAFPTALNVGVNCVTNPFTFSGTAEPGGEVIVEEQPVAPGTSMWTVAADSTGAWSISASHESLVGDHTLTVVVRQRDGGRNEGPDSAAVTFDVCDDKTAPPAPVITQPTPGGLPSGASLLIAGTTVVEIPSVRVFVRERAVNWLSDINWMDKQFREVEATVDAFGNWSYLETFPSSGVTTLTAIAMDASGNRSVESAPVVKMIDVDAPEARISLPSGFLLGDVWILSDPSFAGTAKDNYGLDHIEIVYDPILLGASAATNPAACPQCPTDFDDVADPSDSFSPPTATWSDAPMLDLGLYEMQVTAVDLAGNRSAVASMFVLIVNL